MEYVRNGPVPHLVEGPIDLGGPQGLRDLSGNPVDFRSELKLVDFLVKAEGLIIF